MFFIVAKPEKDERIVKCLSLAWRKQEATVVAASVYWIAPSSCTELPPAHKGRGNEEMRKKEGVFGFSLRIVFTPPPPSRKAEGGTTKEAVRTNNFTQIFRNEATQSFFHTSRSQKQNEEHKVFSTFFLAFGGNSCSFSLKFESWAKCNNKTWTFLRCTSKGGEKNFQTPLPHPLQKLRQHFVSSVSSSNSPR